MEQYKNREVTYVLTLIVEEFVKEFYKEII